MRATESTVSICLGVIVAFVCICCVNGLTCESRCGELLGECSCHATCVSLQNCCKDHGQFCLHVAPYSASMLGGSAFMLRNVTFHPTQQLTCRFRGEVVTDGFIDPEGRGHCISPLLYETGWVPFDVSTDRATFQRSGEYLSVHPSKLDPVFKLTLVNSSHWQLYGTPGTTGALSMTWNPPLLGAERVDVELWGYSEVENNTETAGTASLQGKWTYLYSLGRNLSNSGGFSFLPRPSEKPLCDWRLGSVRVSASTLSAGTRDVRAVWSGAHALAWHLEVGFRQNSAAWAMDRCLEWDALERSLPHFLEEVVDCPCTLAQARADTGRFHTDYGCDIEKGSICTYHPGSVHCVRAIQASPKYGSGQQCCYDSTGAQVLTGDSIGGSTPDRAHDWGSPPYRDPPRVPGLSHWLHDVLSYYYCCLWSDHCQVYFRHRPSSGCRAYQPPRAGSVLGDPHFITFDGLGYSFNGRGEYHLVQSPDKELSVQGRTEQVKLRNGTLAKATRLSSVAMKEKASDVIEVRLMEQQDQLQVLRNQQVLSFSEQSWMDLRGVFLFSPSPHNATVMFSSGVGVEVRGRVGTMTITVLLPPEFTNQTQGLLGQMNFDPEDDLLTSQGVVIHPNSSAEDLFTFGASWNISTETSLFTYDTKYLLDSYYLRLERPPDFLPAFSVSEPPGDPLVEAMSDVCFGDGAQFCKYDTLVMQSLEAGNATLLSYQRHMALLRDLEPVVSCGWLASPTHGQKTGTRYLQGATVQFSCEDGYVIYGSLVRTCLEDGKWSGEPAFCITNNDLGVALATVGCISTLITMGVMIKLHNNRLTRKTGPTGRSSRVGTDLTAVATPNPDNTAPSSV